jgi:hypothetical protein
MLETGDPFSEMEGIDIGTLLFTVPPELYDNSFLFIFVVLVIRFIQSKYHKKTEINIIAHNPVSGMRSLGCGACKIGIKSFRHHGTHTAFSCFQVIIMYIRL